MAVICLTSPMVLTKGSMTLTFFMPMSSLTFLMAFSSHMNASR